MMCVQKEEKGAENVEDDLVSINRILCDCYEDPTPRTRLDRFKEAGQVFLIAVLITMISGLAAVGALNLLLDQLIRLP